MTTREKSVSSLE